MKASMRRGGSVLRHAFLEATLIVSVTHLNTNYASVAERERPMKAGMRRGGSIGHSFLEGMLPTSPPTPPLRTASDETLPSEQAYKDAAAAAASPRSPRLQSSPRLQLSPHAAISAVAAAAVDAADRHPGSPLPPSQQQQQQAWDADASRDNDMRSGFGSVFSEAPLQRLSPLPRRSGDADGAAADALPAAPAAGHASAFGSVAVGWPQDAAAALAGVRHDHSARFPEDAGANNDGEAHSQVSGHSVSGHAIDVPCVPRTSAVNQGLTAQHPRLRCAATQVPMPQCRAS